MATDASTSDDRLVLHCGDEQSESDNLSALILAAHMISEKKGEPARIVDSDGEEVYSTDS